MRFKKQDFVKCMFIALVVVMVAFSFQATLMSSPNESLDREPKSTKQESRGYKTTTETSQGLYTATLSTSRGKINVNLPADMAAGDKISGTVYVEAVGKTEEDKERNLGVLNGIVVEVEEIKNKQTPAAKKRDSWIIPTAINAMHLVFKDKDGNKVGRTEVPVYPESPVSSPAEFQIPEIGQAGNPLHIPGPFDGDFENTGIRIGDFDAETLAESPRGLIILTPHQVTGQTKMTLKERDIERSGKYRSVSVSLAAGELRLKSGQTTELTVTVRGLDGFEDEVPFRLQNKSPGIIRMEGGNTQSRIICGKDIKPGGIYTLTRTLTGEVPGNFGIRATIYPRLKQCAERLGSYTGREYRTEPTDLHKEEILTMPENHFITFTKKDLDIYKNSTDPSVTPQMKECADELLNFLNSAKPEDQQWIADLYMKSLMDALSNEPQNEVQRLAQPEPLEERPQDLTPLSIKRPDCRCGKEIRLTGNSTKRTICISVQVHNSCKNATTEIRIRKKEKKAGDPSEKTIKLETPWGGDVVDVGQGLSVFIFCGGKEHGECTVEWEVSPASPH